MTAECPLGQMIQDQRGKLKDGQTVKLNCPSCSGYANVTGTGPWGLNTAEKRECHEMWAAQKKKSS